MYSQAWLLRALAPLLLQKAAGTGQSGWWDDFRYMDDEQLRALAGGDEEMFDNLKSFQNMDDAELAAKVQEERDALGDARFEVKVAEADVADANRFLDEADGAYADHQTAAGKKEYKESIQAYVDKACGDGVTNVKQDCFLANGQYVTLDLYVDYLMTVKDANLNSDLRVYLNSEGFTRDRFLADIDTTWRTKTKIIVGVGVTGLVVGGGVACLEKCPGKGKSPSPSG